MARISTIEETNNADTAISTEPGSAAIQHALRKPYLLFLGDCTNEAFAKTAIGIHDWARDDVIGQRRFPECSIDLHLPELTQEEARTRGARSFVIGISAAGGKLPENWRQEIIRALEAGLDIVSGLHDSLCEDPEFAHIARQRSLRIHDVRRPNSDFPVGNGRKRTGKRLLTVGTDCALGKKYTALRIVDALRGVGALASFRATGQTGIMIAGSGIPIDAVVSDFVAGAAEALSPDAYDDHWDVIEGQGSLFHPAYAGVTMGLLHGSQPDALVLCHDPTRARLNMFSDFAIPTLTDAARRYVEAAQLTNRDARISAISLNTSKLNDGEAHRAAEAAEAELGVPCMDPMRFGVDRVVANLRREFA